ncbi:unnamed protein product, partial [Pylaiella littoralis]
MCPEAWSEAGVDGAEDPKAGTETGVDAEEDPKLTEVVVDAEEDPISLSEEGVDGAEDISRETGGWISKMCRRGVFEVDGGAGEMEDEGGCFCNKRRTFINVSPSKFLPFHVEGWAALG